MIRLHCLRDKSNNKTRGQFECDVTWFSFCFDFVLSHARCEIECTVHLFRESRGSFKIGRRRSRGKRNLGRT